MNATAGATSPDQDPTRDLSDWEIRSFTPGRLRIKSPSLVGQTEGHPIIDALRTHRLADSIDVSPLTGSILFRYPEAQYSRRAFVAELLGSLPFSAATRQTMRLLLDAHLAAEAARLAALSGNGAGNGAGNGGGQPSTVPLRTRALALLWGAGAGLAGMMKRAAGSTAAPPPPSGNGGAPSAGASDTIPQAERAALQELKWNTKSDLPGRLRVHHPLVRTYAIVAQKVELTLVNLDGVSDYKVSSITSNVLIQYDPKRLSRGELLDILSDTVDVVVRESDLQLDRSLRHLALASANLVLACAAFFVPVLAPIAIVTTLVVSMRIFRGAYEAAVIDRRIKVDILDAVVIVLSLAFGQVFAGAVMVLVVEAGYTVLTITSKTSQQLLAKVFGKQVRTAWMLVDGQEVECKVSALKPGDTIVVGSGEQIPVDGVVVGGEAMVDQHALTGESAPVERTTGEPVFAMTVVIAGKLQVRVNETGENTNAAKIVRIIEQSMEHKVQLQSTAERFADLAVVPTLGLGAAGFSFVSPDAMLAIINADYATGIRVAGPTALLASLAAAAKNGIIIKNANVLEGLSRMDAVIFDKTGTLTQETPVVGDIIPCDPAFTPENLLGYVACAEQKMAHPIAKAIVQKARDWNLELPALEDSQYHIGFGIQVQINADTVKVGSLRYMKRENISIPGHISSRLQDIHKEGRSAVLAAVNERLAGAIELQASSRPEAYQVIETLRTKRGLKEIYLISGDHEAATKALAGRLGIPNYFAEVLPQDKAAYVKQLQAKGLKVAMVGDGINDSVALTQADFSISLRGASDIATDVADVVFMDGNLAKFDMLFQISENLVKNVRRSFMLVVVPNSLCMAGAFLGVVGLGTSLVLNNGFNLVATVNGLLPYYGVLEELDVRNPAERPV